MSPTSRHFGQLISVHFTVIIILLGVCQRTESAIGDPINLLPSASVESVSTNATRCCTTVGGVKCSNTTMYPLCAFDDNSSTAWTLGSNQTSVDLILTLNSSAILDRVEVTLDPSSIIPNSLTITVFSQDHPDNDIQWITYFNKTCQTNDMNLRKQGSQYYSCYSDGQSRNVSLPHGLLSVQNVQSEWMWWRTFQSVQVTIEATSADYMDNMGTGMISISDIRLYGWYPQTDRCNCHPAGVSNTSDPCDQAGVCKCRHPNINDQCVPSINTTSPVFGPLPKGGTVSEPTTPSEIYGPVSGGTAFSMTGHFFSLLSAVTIGNTPAAISSTDSFLVVQTIAAHISDTCDIGKPCPVLLHFDQPNVSCSFVITDSEFTFKPDPIVTSITPGRSITSGGILQTVYGQNLDSVQYSYLIIAVVTESSSGNTYLAYPRDASQLYSDSFCQAINSTMLTCPTPDIHSDSIGSGTQFNVSVYLDSKTSTNFTNYCQFTSGNCRIAVANNPNIYTWTGDPSSVVGFPYYKGLRTKEINGNGFTYAPNGGDYTSEYTVSVGGVNCKIDDIINNVIVFEVPDPSLIDTSKKQTAIVSIGSYSITLGSLIYYINWIDDPANRNPLIGGLVGGIGGAILVAIVLILVIRCIKRRKDGKGYRQSEDYSYQSIASYFPEDIQKYSVSFDRVKMNGELGKGNFGKVYKGALVKPDNTEEVVAIKTLHGKVLRFEDKLEFLQEAMVMADFCHSHVLALIAICIHDQKPYVILPLMEHGDLRGFVSKTDQSFTAGDLVNFCVQVAEGMEYLSSLKFVHRDLAARNCMINKNFLVKVADFGLARDIFEKDYYRSEANEKPLPVKWMAIECLQNSGQFTEKSDVWSYGVLVWELMTRGQKPYCDVDNFALRKYLENGKRLDKPNSTPDFINDLMQRCWLKDRNSRPTFKKIVQELKSILSVGQSAGNPSQHYDEIDKNHGVEGGHKSYLLLMPDE